MMRMLTYMHAECIRGASMQNYCAPSSGLLLEVTLIRVMVALSVCIRAAGGALGSTLTDMYVWSCHF